jgi:hypothetical protein
VDALMREDNGIYMIWTINGLVDSRGNYFKKHTQIDSLMFLITLNNTAWSSINSNMEVLVHGKPRVVPLINFDQYQIPDISNIENQIFLVSKKGEFIKPRYMGGRRNNILTTEESLFAMFYFREGDHHFLSNSDEMYLLIKGFEGDIRLEFPLSMMR